MKKLIAIALVTAFILSACASSGSGNPAGATLEPASSPTPGSTDAVAPTSGETNYERLDLVRREQTYGGGNVLIYPAVEADGYDALNAAIYKKILTGLGEMDAPVYTYFNIKCNQDGILSILVNYYDTQTRELYLKLPMTFDVATGNEILIQDCFDAADDRWRSVLPDIVTNQAESIDMTLLSNILPIADGQLFYLTGRSLVLLYRPYEITTFLSGWPEFSIGFNQISSYMDENAAAMRLIHMSETVTEEGGGA